MRTRRYLVLALSTALGVCSLSAVPAAQATTPTASTQSALTHTDLAPGVLSAAAKTERWVHSGSNWYRWESDIGYAQGWRNIDGHTYFFNRHTYAMVTGWLFEAETWYYFDASGAAASGWLFDGGKWYYLGYNGIMHTGWLQQGRHWYYLMPGSGAMVTGDTWINGKLHQFTSSGRWHKGLPT